MLLKIIVGAPIWVWPLLMFMLWTGFRASRDRTVTVAPYYFYPFFGIIGLNGIADLAQPATAWTGFCLGYAMGIFAGFLLQKRWLISVEHNKIKLRGDWLTLFLLMMIFWSNFVGGVLDVVNPALASSQNFILIFVLIKGLVSGSFLGRSIKVILVYRASPELRVMRPSLN